MIAKNVLTFVVTIYPIFLNAGVYKCIDENGDMAYRDLPCPTGNQTLHKPPTLPRSTQRTLSVDAVTTARTLLALGSSPGDVPQLLEMLSDERMIQITYGVGFFVGTLGELAALRLVSVGDAAVNPLQEVLSNAGPHARLNACTALGKLKAPAAIPAIVFALSDSDAQVRDAAAQSLLTFDLRRPDLIPVLIRNVRNHPTEKNPAVAFSALNYLGFLNHPDAIAFLQQAAHSRDDRLSYNARQVLEKYGKQEGQRGE